jgi:hypothetical protein
MVTTVPVPYLAEVRIREERNRKFAFHNPEDARG